MLNKKQAFFVILTLILVLLFGLYYFLVQYPKVIVQEAHTSLRVGEEITQYLDPASKFFQTLEIANVTSLVFRTDENQVCKIVNNREIHKDEEYFLSDTFLKSDCSKLCLTLTPSFLIRGSFCVQLDVDKKISSKEEPFFWINYKDVKAL